MRLLSNVVQAEGHTRDIMAGPALPEVIQELTATARRRGCHLLVGASSGAHQLVGAVSHATRGEFRPWGPEDVGDVLVVDGVVAGLAGVTSVMEVIRKMTNANVYGVALTLSLVGGARGPDVDVLRVDRLAPAVSVA